MKRLLSNVVLVAAAFGLIFGIGIVACALLSDAKLSPWERALLFGVGFSPIASFFAVLVGRTRWLRRHAVYVSWAGLQDAVAASFGVERPTDADLQLLRASAPHAAASLQATYEHARAHRNQSPAHETLFRSLADAIYRVRTSETHAAMLDVDC